MAAIEEALEVQHQGSARDTQRLHLAEQWRDRLIADDEALQEWLRSIPDADLQRLRTLIRQARGTRQASPAARRGTAPRQVLPRDLPARALKLDGGDAAAAQAAEDAGKTEKTHE